jgi:uncharacterized protein YndB with AHSA1/START domain
MNTADDENMLTFERVINAPRTLVWQAWTDPKHASQWWGPAGGEVLVFEADLRRGGRFRIDVDYGGTTTRIEGVYEDVVALERLVSVASLARNDVKLMDSRRVVTFEDDGDKTRITLCQAFYNLTAEGAEAVTGTREGMKQHFDRLEEHLIMTESSRCS